MEALFRAALHTALRRNGSSISRELLDGCDQKQLNIENEIAVDDGLFRLASLSEHHDNETDHRRVPNRPLYRPLANQMLWLIFSGKQKKFSRILLLDDKPEIVQSVDEEITNAMPHMKKAVNTLEKCQSDISEASHHLDTAMSLLSQLSLLRLLGLRLTTGTMTAVVEQCQWPPVRQDLLTSFNALHLPNSVSILTVGAKALAKHTIRHKDWWGGQLNGGEALKSHLALLKVEEIIQNTSWMNLHVLPGDLLTFEIRISEGYGARWCRRISDTQNDNKWKFRGFLEPQQENGFEVGWKH